MHRPCILIADNDRGVIKFLRVSLRAKDYDVLSAMDGAEAMETTEPEHITTVLGVGYRFGN